MPQVLNKHVGPVGFGLMSLAPRQLDRRISDEEVFKTMKVALDSGCNFWNGGEFYGTPDHNSLTLLNRYFTKYPEDADKVVLSIKGCLNIATFAPDNSEEGIERSISNCLKLLDGKKTIDFFECARVDPNIPIEDNIATLAKYVKAGKIGGITLSEVKPETIRRAHKVHPIGAVEMELSLWSTYTLTNGVADVCAELGIPLIAYSPMGRGMLAGAVKNLEDLPQDDLRRQHPRFKSEAFETNIKLFHKIEQLANSKGCTPSQLAITWAQKRTGKPPGFVVIPIPGTSKASRVAENAKLVEWSEKDEEEINKILAASEVVGARYPEHSVRFLDG